MVVNLPDNFGLSSERRDQLRFNLETAVLGWSTQLSFCAGLFEFSREQGRDETLGMSEFIAGVNELVSPMVNSSPSSRRASSEFDDHPSPKSTTSSAKQSPPNSEASWLTSSPRLASTPSSGSPLDASPLEASSAREHAPRNAWVAYAPREALSSSGERPSPLATSTWSSATRPTTSRAQRNFISNNAAMGDSSPTASSSTPPTSAPTSPPTSHHSAPSTESNTPISSPMSQKSLSASHGGHSTKMSSKIHSATSGALAPVRSLTQTLGGQLGLKKKSNNKLQSPIAIAKLLGMEDLPPKLFSKLPAVSVATVSIYSTTSSTFGKWFNTPMRLRIHNAGTHTALALYTAENWQLGIQVPVVAWRMNAFSSKPTEAIIASITTVSNDGFPLAVFMDSTTNFFWIREGPGLNSTFCIFTASDLSSMTSYLRSTFGGINFGQMKPAAYMSVFMHHWIETCLDGIPPEPKRAFDLACVDKSGSKNMLESLELFETRPDQLPPLVQALHWYPYLCDLTLHGCGISDEYAIPIINLITLNSQIKSLSMASNNLSNGCVPALHGLLTRSSKRLMILDLSDNPFNNKAIAGILEALSQNMSVKRFSLAGVPIYSKTSLVALTQLLERNRSLLSLKVSLAPAQNAEKVAETFIAPIFHALLNNTIINALDLGLPQGSPTYANILQLVHRNAKGASSVTLAGWLSDWPRLLDFTPTTTEHYQKILRCSDKPGVYWKGVSSFTGTMEEGPSGTLSISRDGIVFTPAGYSPTSSSLSLTSSGNGTTNSAFGSANSSNGSQSGSDDLKAFSWSGTLKVGQLTTDPVLLVFYDPARFADPLVVTMAEAEQVLEAVICLNALEAVATATAKPTSRNRAHALGSSTNTSIEYFLDFSKAELGDLLAPAGGSGTEVRIAKLLGFDCCVKIMDCSQYGQDSVDSMEKEISLLIMSKRCKHIVQYLHHQRTGHQLRLYMELFPGSLKKLISNRAVTNSYFSPTQVYMLARSMLKALNFLHTQPQPIVHRDIKSDNYLVEEDLFGNFVRVKLTDFGSAKILTRGRTSSIDQGTSGYQAPEMVRGPEGETEDGTPQPLSYTTAVDIFAFGITMYEILTLQKVYPHCQSRQELEEALRNAEKVAPDYKLVPRPLLHFLLIVSPCLKRNYKDRPTAAELLEQLGKIAEELKISKTRTGSNSQLHKAPGRSIVISPRPH